MITASDLGLGVKGGVRPFFTIVVDTREQCPYGFFRYIADAQGRSNGHGQLKHKCEVTKATLPSGDYSLVGYEGTVAIERKEIDDLMNCLSHDRERFEKELGRLADYNMAAVVIEATMEDVSNQRYISRMNPHAALQSCLAFQIRYKIPFVWAGTRRAGEYTTFWLLQKYYESSNSRGKTEVLA